VISGFRCEVEENCAILGHYAASGGNFLPTFRDNHLQGSRIKKRFLLSFTYRSYFQEPGIQEEFS
jgi:hypothetical protein